MKRVDAMVPSIKRNAVINAIMGTGVGGTTITESRGKGSGERPSFTGAKGTARYVAEYARMDTITTIVDDALVDKVVTVIMKEASTGKRGDGKIFVSTVETIYDICTQKKEM